MKNKLKIKLLVNFVKKKFLLLKLDITVIWLVNLEDTLIKNAILMSHRIEVVLYHLYFTLLVITTVIYSSRNQLMKIMIKMKIKVIPRTNEEYLSLNYGGCNIFINSYRVLSKGLDELVKTLDIDHFFTLKKTSW